MIDLHVFFPFKFLLQWGCQLNMFYDLGHVFLVLWNFFYNLSSVHLFPPFFNSWHRSLEILVVAMIPFCWILLSFWQLESPHANWIYGVNRFMRSLKFFFFFSFNTLVILYDSCRHVCKSCSQTKSKIKIISYLCSEFLLPFFRIMFLAMKLDLGQLWNSLCVLGLGRLNAKLVVFWISLTLLFPSEFVLMLSFFFFGLQNRAFGVWILLNHG